MQYGRARVRTEGLVVALIRVDVLLLGAAANRQTRQDKTRHDKTGAPSVTCQHAYGLSAPHAMSVQFSSVQALVLTNAGRPAKNRLFL